MEPNEQLARMFGLRFILKCQSVSSHYFFGLIHETIKTVFAIVLAWIDFADHEILVVSIDMILSAAPSRKSLGSEFIVYVCIVFVWQQKYSLN
jgi:hypothetical protein